jgi:sugar porter (SP) family MFS transporter
MFRVADRNQAQGVGGVVLRDVLPKRDKLWIFYPGLLQLNICLLGALVCDVTNGYDGSMLNGIQSVDPWQDYFHHPKGGHLGLITNGARIGQIAALIIISPLINWLGRRWPIVIGSVIILGGVALQSASKNVAMFVLGRVMLGFGNNIQQCASPILISELAYPVQRPKITAIMNTTGSLGQIMAAWITYGTAKGFPTSSWSWRLPSVLQAVSSIFQIIMITFFTPESPRWLAWHGRTSEARAILTKYHAEGDETSPLVSFEMAEIEYTLEAEKTKSKGASWLEWFRTPANRHRFFIILTLGFMIQWCGNAVLSYYLHLVLNSFGITSSTTQLIINGCNTISGFCFGILWSLLIDRMGRRTLFLGGMAGMFCAFLLLTVFTGVNSGEDFKNQGLSGAAVAMIFVFGAFYKMAGPTQDAYFMEISPYGLRAKTSVIKQFGDAGANLFSGFVNPIGLEAIAWKYYIVWCCVLISNFLIIYFFFPETKNLSLEEVTQMFDGHEISHHAIKEQEMEREQEREKEDAKHASVEMVESAHGNDSLA